MADEGKVEAAVLVRAHAGFRLPAHHEAFSTSVAYGISSGCIRNTAAPTTTGLTQEGCQGQVKADNRMHRGAEHANRA
jgi:hypothetical protein